jgi:hypothetical protein
MYRARIQQLFLPPLLYNSSICPAIFSFPKQQELNNPKTVALAALRLQ